MDQDRPPLSDLQVWRVHLDRYSIPYAILTAENHPAPHESGLRAYPPRLRDDAKPEHFPRADYRAPEPGSAVATTIVIDAEFGEPEEDEPETWPEPSSIKPFMAYSGFYAAVNFDAEGNILGMGLWE